MAYPTLKPSARTYTPGNWANKQYNSISGSETRIRYGDKRYNATLQLTYSNISDTDADKFLADYDANFGTYKKFTLPSEVLAGWSGTNYVPDTGAMQFRYSAPPSIASVRPGVSVVTIQLVGVV